MPSKVYSAAVVGVEAFEVEIEVHAGWGNTDKIAVVGLPDPAVKESKDRVTSAISNSAFRWPYGKRITINLAPADVRKEGPSFDLPIALGMLKLEENNRLLVLDAFCITGELALSGQLRPVKGVLSIALEAKRRCRQTLIVPLENAAEAAVVEGVDVYGASRFRRSCIFCAATSPWSRSAQSTVGPPLDQPHRTLISARSEVSSMSNVPSKSPPRAGTTF
jgi:magnesium chelatase family protein